MPRREPDSSPNAVPDQPQGETTLRTSITFAALVAAAALAACTPAQDEAAENAGDATADAAAGAASGPTTPGGMVSPPQGNEAVDTGNTTETNLSAGSTSFTEAQARGHIESAGYTGVTALTKTPDGMWTGTATKAGKTGPVSVDFKGAVSAK
jgi:hypothetical protein